MNKFLIFMFYSILNVISSLLILIGASAVAYYYGISDYKIGVIGITSGLAFIKFYAKWEDNND